MRRWTMFAALLAGCYRPALEDACTVACPDDFCPGDMQCGGDKLCHPRGTGDCSTLADANPNDTATEVCLGDGFVKQCFERPTAPLMFSTDSFDTNSGPCTLTRTEADGTTLCFLVGTRVEIDGTFRATGQHPLVLVGVDEVVVQATGVINVSSIHTSLIAGAGAGEAKGCAPSIAIGGVNDPAETGGGGGAGGSFRARGGNGGSGNNGTQVLAGGVAVNALPVPSSLRGGCPGGIGGYGVSGSGGVGGYGGGAIYLLSGGMIRILGRINASGAGGGRPNPSGGAGGGGSGGFIGLDAKAYSFDATTRVYAVGGSGGAGASPVAVGVAGNQASGPSASPLTMTVGTGGSGGAGGAIGAGAAGSAASLGGGGGGGGSMGFIGMANMNVVPVGTFAPPPVAMN
ncbi:MAG TPA: hypothetical protein VIV11_37210 [Kofleriaceae bacterium]